MCIPQSVAAGVCRWLHYGSNLMKNLECRTTEQGTLQSWVGSFQLFYVVIDQYDIVVTVVPPGAPLLDMVFVVFLAAHSFRLGKFLSESSLVICWYAVNPWTQIVSIYPSISFYGFVSFRHSLLLFLLAVGSVENIRPFSLSITL
jgi:hypothetical protein